MVEIPLERIVMRDNEQLIKVRYLADLHRQILAAVGVHIRRRLVKKGDPYIRKLLQQCQPHRQCRRHLFAARQALKRPLVPALFQHDAVIFAPPQRLFRIAEDLAEKIIRLPRDVVDVIPCDERCGLLESIANKLGRFKSFIQFALFVTARV